MERLRGWLLSFPPFVSSLVLGNRVRKEAIFLLCVHTYSIHTLYIYIYIYINLQNQKVGFPMKYLFFNNQLVFKCDLNYNVQLSQGF